MFKFQGQKADVAARGGYMPIAYSKGNEIEKENCPGIFYGFRACSTYDLASGHNLLHASSDFRVSLLAYKE